MPTVPSPPTTPVVAQIGAFDLASYGDQIFPLVAAHELGRRLDGVELVPFGPVGSTGTPSGPGSRTWALGPWSPERAAAVARRATLVLCGGGEFVQGDGGIYAPFYGIDPADAAELRMDRWFIEVLGAAEATCPVVWHAPGVPADLDDGDAERVRAAVAGRAVVAVRDELSRARLEAAGVEREIAVVPDSALLLPRVLTPATLAGHREHLRADDRYPADGPVVVVQGNHTMTRVRRPARRSPHRQGARRPGGARCRSARATRTGGSPTRSPRHSRAAPGRVPDDSPLEAVAAAIAGADCFLGVSLHGAITAYTYGRPHVTFDPFGHPKLEGFADLVARAAGSPTIPSRPRPPWCAGSPLAPSHRTAPSRPASTPTSTGSPSCARHGARSLSTR